MPRFSDEIQEAAEAVRAAAAKVQAKIDYEAAFDENRKPRDNVFQTNTNHIPVSELQYLSDPTAYIEQDLYANYYNWVPDSFHPFQDLPEPETSQHMAAKFETICGPMDAGNNISGGNLGDAALGHVEDIKDNLISWNGHAAENFRDNFVNDLSTLIDEHAGIGRFLGATVKANEGLLRSARLDVKTIASNAVTAIEASADSGSDDVILALTVIAAAATIAAGIATIPVFGTGIPVMAAGCTILAGVAAAATPMVAENASDTSIPLDADTVDGVLENMVNALDNVDSKITTAENEMNGRLVDVIDQISADLNGFIPRRPASLIDADNPTASFTPPIR